MIVIDVSKDKPKKSIVIKKTKPESPFQKSKAIQEQYAVVLKGVAKEVGKLIKGYAPNDLISAEKLKRALRSYSDIIGPWAVTIATRFLASIQKQDWNAWQAHSKEMSKEMRNEILNAPTGEVMQDLMLEQVELIKSIPLEAANRVHNLVIENLAQSARAEEIAKKILETEGIAKHRAVTIARTEMSRAATSLTRARAEYIGSTGYIWQTSKDLIVRKSHKEMQGKFVRWDSPPELDKMVGHAGGFPNCRCWPEPEIPEKF